MSSPVVQGFAAFFMAAVICAANLTATASAVMADTADDYDEPFFASNNIDWYDPRCPDISAAGAGKSVQLAGKDNLEKILNFFMREAHLSLAQAAGIVGNMMQESGLNPAIIQGGKIADDHYTPEPNVGFGLVQWTSPGRQKNLVAHMKGLGVANTDLSGQLSFTWKEMNDSYSHVVRALQSPQAAKDPVVAAIIVHGRADSSSGDKRYAEAMKLLSNQRGYEASGDSGDKVVSVRGGNAQQIFDKYNDAPALAGSTADMAMKPAGEGSDDQLAATVTPDQTDPSGCASGQTGDASALVKTVKGYAWPTYKGNDVTPTDTYRDAVAKALSEGRYVGGSKYKGIDCGGFVTLAIHDSGFDKGYNSDGGNTITQEKWLAKNWRQLTRLEIIGPKQTGDVAINEDHTYMYISNDDKAKIGFQTNIASASLDQRAPMAGKESAIDSAYRWYRKK